MQAREAVPRSEEPTVTISQRKDKRWHVYVRLPDGRNCNSTCKTQKDAKDRAEDFLAGLDVKLPGAATGAAAACRKSPRGHDGPTPPPPKRVSPNFVAGPGRGHKDRVTRATIALTALKKQLVLDFADSVLTTDVCDMDELFIKAHETIHSSRVMADKVLFDASETVILSQKREASVPAVSRRTAQRHRATLQHTLTEIAGSNVEHKISLASQVLASLQKQVQPTQNKHAAREDTNEANAHKFIVLGLRYALAQLKLHHSGRYTHDARVFQQSILGAASCQLPSNSMTAAARLLDTDVDGLRLARSRWDSYEAGERDTLFDKAETASRPYPYAQFVSPKRLENTRESERMRDELKNPKDRSDPTLYRVHFQEDRTDDILDRIFEAGVHQYGPSFHLTITTLLKYKPFQVRKAKAETCVCVHHLKWAKMMQVYRKQRQAEQGAVQMQLEILTR